MCFIAQNIFTEIGGTKESSKQKADINGEYPSLRFDALLC